MNVLVVVAEPNLRVAVFKVPKDIVAPAFIGLITVELICISDTLIIRPYPILIFGVFPEPIVNVPDELKSRKFPTTLTPPIVFVFVVVPKVKLVVGVNAIVPADIVKSPVFIAVVPPVDINLLDGNALGISVPAEYMSIDE